MRLISFFSHSIAILFVAQVSCPGNGGTPPMPPNVPNKFVNITVLNSDRQFIHEAAVTLDEVTQFTDDKGFTFFTVSPKTNLTELIISHDEYNLYETPLDTTNTVTEFEALLSPIQTICGKLFINERFIRCPDDSVFRWRGATWFRYLHQVVNDEDVSYLDELRDKGFNVIRVLSTAVHLFDLLPEDGLASLPNALTIARDKGIYVQIVAVVDSGDREYDFISHARGVAEICNEHANCIYDFANEPWHHTQHDDLHNLSNVTEFASNAVEGLDLVYTAGASEVDEPICVDPQCNELEIPQPIGAFLSPHLDRGREDWNNIRRLREFELLSSLTDKPIVNDESMGFDEVDGSVTGRQRWGFDPNRASRNPCDIALVMGALSRVFEIGSNYHSQNGLQSQEFKTVQSRCADNFITGVTIIPDEITLQFKNTGWADSPIESANFDDDDGCCVTRVYSGLGAESIAVAFGITGDPEIKTKNGWILGESLINRDAVKVWKLVRENE